MKINVLSKKIPPNNGLVVWSLKIKKIEKLLKDFFNDFNLFPYALNLRITIFSETLEFILNIYISCIPSRKRFPQYINDLNFILSLTVKTFDQFLQEFQLILLENMEKSKDIETFFLIHEVFSKMLKIWIIIKNLNLFDFLIESKYDDMELFLSDYLNAKKKFLIIEPLFYNRSSDNELKNLQIQNCFNEVRKTHYLKFIKLISKICNKYIFYEMK